LAAHSSSRAGEIGGHEATIAIALGETDVRRAQQRAGHVPVGDLEIRLRTGVATAEHALRAVRRGETQFAVVEAREHREQGAGGGRGRGQGQRFGGAFRTHVGSLK
jgi:hypothetical protein